MVASDPCTRPRGLQLVQGVAMCARHSAKGVPVILVRLLAWAPHLGSPWPVICPRIVRGGRGVRLWVAAGLGPADWLVHSPPAPAALGAAAPSLSRPLGALGKSELGPHGATLAAEKAEEDSQGPGSGCGSDWMQLPPSGTITHSSCSFSCRCGSAIKAGVVGKGGPRGQVSLARHTFTGCL